ncbi:hypothetical protein DFH09DRAFT_1094643 [Mycena vulgaris]|nr:hypothetical protein DFH09DRAFT_1094643 [Mycena vulgaris]
MSGSGVTYYQEELKQFLRLLSESQAPGGHRYAPNGKEVDEKGCLQSVSRDPGLEEVVVVLRDYITGNGSANSLHIRWVDALRHAARVAIEAAGKPLPRDVKTTSAKRRLESEKVEKNKNKKAKQNQKEARGRVKAATEEARKATEQGAVWVPISLGFLN